MPAKAGIQKCLTDSQAASYTWLRHRLSSHHGHGNALGEVNSAGVVNPDANGIATPLREFDPWGFVNNWQQVADNGNNLKYCGSLGHPSENNTGLIYMRARYYDPVTGRFISEDPSQNGANWFGYASGNPTRYFDATGKASDNSFDPVYQFDANQWWKDWMKSFSKEIVFTAFELSEGLSPFPDPGDIAVDVAVQAGKLRSASEVYGLNLDIFNLINARETAWYNDLFPDESL